MPISRARHHQLMAEVISPELTLSVLRTLQILLKQYPQATSHQSAPSLKLRTVCFDLYNELIFLLRYHQVDFEHVRFAIDRQYENLIHAVHRLYVTDQFGSVFNVPQ